jgi:hypothetical protein
MAIGRKTGGRVAGTPNRKTREISELLDSLGCDPVQGMAEIAMNTNASLELRGRMYAELAQYVYPKRKAIAMEHAGAGRGGIMVIVDGAPGEPLSPRET